MRFSQFKPLILALLATPALASPSVSPNFREMHYEEISRVQNGETVNAPVCVANSWKEHVPTLESDIARLRENFPKAFLNLPGHEKDTCFDITRISVAAAPMVQSLFDRIEQAAPEAITPMEISSEGGDSLKKSTQLVLNKNIRPLKNSDRSYGHKMLHAEAILLPVDALSYYGLLRKDPSVSNWDPDPIGNAGKNIKYAWSHLPVLDRDNFATNFIAHPYAGSLSYSAIRSQGGTKLQSFGFAVIRSTWWEFVWEATAEKPSIQDLIATPVLGSFIGEGQHALTNLFMRDGRLSTLEKILLPIINPTQVLNNGFHVDSSAIR